MFYKHPISIHYNQIYVVYKVKVKGSMGHTMNSTTTLCMS